MKLCGRTLTFRPTPISCWWSPGLWPAFLAKVDALMALCDRLEASLTAAANTRRSLLDALLAEALAPDEERELEAAE